LPRPEQSAVLAEVVAAVGVQALRLVPGTATAAADAWYRVQQRDELGDIVPVAAGQ
jgi:hypothetical protein